MQPRSDPIPRLLFGEANALVQRDFQALADQFSHLVPEGDFDASTDEGFLYKGHVFAMPGLVFNQAINSHMVVQTGFAQYGLSLILFGDSSVAQPRERRPAMPYDALFSPPGTDLRFETSADRLTSSLHITFDLERLNQVSLAMQGGEGLAMTQTHLRAIRLRYGPVNLRQLFLQLILQIDAFAGNAALLQLAGFDDQVYRLLAMTLQPEVFLKDHLTPQEQRQLHNPRALAQFEHHVEAHLEEPLRLTDIEILLGISSRTLQYACMKKHGCSPTRYIRNRKLDLAYALLRQQGGDITLAEVAARLHFSSQSQFSRYFRERFGVLPSALRQTSGIGAAIHSPRDAP